MVNAVRHRRGALTPNHSFQPTSLPSPGSGKAAAKRVHQVERMEARVWTEADYEQMSWHDNHIHALRFVEGQDGTGDLILDLDYILEWLKGDGGGFRFRIIPVTLTFHEVMFPKIAVNYASASAAFGPFMIHGIERRFEKRAHYTAQVWKLPITFPNGEIEFEAQGFTQRAAGAIVESEGQRLSISERDSGT